MSHKLKNIFSSVQATVTIFLGAFWLLDGILQLQPQIFTKVFITDVLRPNLAGQPLFIANLIHFGINIYGSNIFLINMCAAFIQIFIGVVLLVPQLKMFRKVGLYTSIIWALTAWIFAEGMGNLFTGMTSFYIGAPGSAFLYVILGVFLLFPDDLPSYYLPQFAGVLFFLGGLLNEIPMFWHKGMQAMFWQMSQQDNISVIASPTKVLSTIVTSANITKMLLR